MGLYQIRVEVEPPKADLIDNVLLELGVDRWSLLENAIARRVWVVGIFDDEEEARRRWQELRPRLPVSVPMWPEISPLPDRDWRESYKEHFKAWKFGRLNWVPLWEREGFVLPAGEEVLWLDPGMAFGTGNHETTRLMVERLVHYVQERGADGRVIDAGCGSGILALSAAKLGCRTIAGFDNDPEAIRVSGENAGLNGLAGQVDFYLGDLVTGLAGRQADLVLANIQADVLMRFAHELCASVAPRGQLLLSGILIQELAAVRARFTEVAAGWWFGESRTLGEWADLVLARPA
jgi:ribosomal protein L11 methyltransferase